MKLSKQKSAPTARQRHASRHEEKSTTPSMSYYSRRAPENANTGRTKLFSKQRPDVNSLVKFWGQRLGLLVLVVALIASAVSIISLSNNAKVLSVDGEDKAFFLHDQAEYQSTASQLLASSIWNRNKITVDTNKVESELKRQFPELSTVSVTLPLLGHRPIVYIQAAQPAIILTAGNYSFVLDGNGRALLRSGSVSFFSSLGLPVVLDQSGLDPKVGRVALAGSSVEFIQTVVAQLKEKKQSVATVKLPAGTSQLDVQVRGQSYYIKFNLQSNDARRQVGTYLATQDWLASKNQTPSQYIDVRVEGRSYFK